MKKSNSIISADPSGLLGESVPAEGAEEGAEDALGESEWRSAGVPPELHGQRLDRAVAFAVPEFSRSYLQQLIADGAVRCNGQTAGKQSSKVRAGDRIEVELRPTPQSQAFVPEAMPLTVVHEDDHLLVIDKPVGLVVHPAPGNWSGTLLNGLLARDPRAATLPRAGIVHRLDKDTSGLMVVARTRLAMDALVQRIAAREVSRQYLALAHRPWTGSSTRDVDAPVGRDPRNRLKMAVVDNRQHAGKEARTTIELLSRADAGCWVRCTLHTGRTHQIRVHMASIGHPLVGDTVYGGASAAGLERQALHAFRLAFVHPMTGEDLAFVSTPPADMLAALQAWGLDYNPPIAA